jgi:hypothetical protein
MQSANVFPLHLILFCIKIRLLMVIVDTAFIGKWVPPTFLRIININENLERVRNEERIRAGFQ